MKRATCLWYLIGICILLGCSNERLVTFDFAHDLVRSEVLVFQVTKVVRTNYNGYLEDDLLAAALINVSSGRSMNTNHWGRETLVFFPEKGHEILVNGIIDQMKSDGPFDSRWIYGFRPAKLYVLEPTESSNKMKLKSLSAQHIFVSLPPTQSADRAK